MNITTNNFNIREIEERDINKIFINSLNNVVGLGISKLVPQKTMILSILSLPIILFTLIIGLDNDILIY